MSSKVNIDSRYFPEEDLKTDYGPYIAFADCLGASVLNSQDITSLCDVGCANGLLISVLKRVYPDMQVKGYDYFEWMKENSPHNIRENIEILDLRDPFDTTTTSPYDIVVCTETGEHIEPEYTDILLNNLLMLAKKYVVTTWAETGGVNDPSRDPHCQHLNPLSIQEYMSLFRNKDFKEEKELTGKFLERANQHPHFHDHWRRSLIIWSRP